MSASASTKDPRDAVRTVNIIVPVPHEPDIARHCIESLLAHTDPVRGHLVLVGDARAGRELRQWSPQLQDRDRATLLESDLESGFTARANRGIALNPERDVVIVDSATRVPAGWLERLQACALRADDIATVTPFCNNGTLCSYPRFFENCGIPAGLDPDTLDGLFSKANPGRSLEIPLAEGFCLYIRHECLRSVGLFNDEHYNRGDNGARDFSLRARAANWRNLVCGDLFIQHRDDEGDTDGQSPETIALEETRLLKRYPGHTASMARFFAEDPLQEFRNGVNRLRLEIAGQAELVMNELTESLRACRRLSLPLMESLQAQAEDYLELESKYREINASWDAERIEYERELEKTRSAYSRTDAALGKAQEIVADYRQQITDYSQQIESLSASINSLERELQRIKSSRTWRYRAKLMALLGRQ